jgi:hypothetical protein
LHLNFQSTGLPAKRIRVKLSCAHVTFSTLSLSDTHSHASFLHPLCTYRYVFNHKKLSPPNSLSLSSAPALLGRWSNPLSLPPAGSLVTSRQSGAGINTFPLPVRTTIQCQCFEQPSDNCSFSWGVKSCLTFFHFSQKVPTLRYVKTIFRFLTQKFMYFFVVKYFTGYRNIC